MWQASSRPFCVARSASALTASPRLSRRRNGDRGPGRSLPASILEKSRMSLMIVSSESADDLTMRQVLALLGGQVGVQRQFGHADDAVHRRANLVAHVGQEGALCKVGLAGGFESRFGLRKGCGLKPLQQDGDEEHAQDQAGEAEPAQHLDAAGREVLDRVDAQIRGSELDEDGRDSRQRPGDAGAAVDEPYGQDGDRGEPRQHRGLPAAREPGDARIGQPAQQRRRGGRPGAGTG